MDELPSLIEEGVLSLSAVNDMESAIDREKPSYNFLFSQEKNALLSSWLSTVRIPFFNLCHRMRKGFSLYGLVSDSAIEEASFK